MAHDNGNTSLSHLLGPRRPALLQELSYRYAPVIGQGGTLYVSSKTSLLALTPSGQVRWKYDSRRHDVSVSDPSVSKNGVLYSSTSDGLIVGLTPNGRKRWEFDMGSWPADPPMIAADGTVYCASGQGRLFAVAPNGRKQWVFVAWDRAEWLRAAKYNLDVDQGAAPNGTVYVAVRGPRLYAVSPAGKKLWSLSPNAFPVRPAVADLTWENEDEWLAGRAGPDVRLGTPTVAPDGTVYVIASAFRGEEDRSRLFAIDADGSTKWSRDGGDNGMFLTLALGPDGTVYAVDDWRCLTAFDPSDGSRKWRVPVNYAHAQSVAGPSVDASGTIYVASKGTGASAATGTLYAIDSSGGRKWSMRFSGAPEYFPSSSAIVIGPNRRLYLPVARSTGPRENDTQNLLLVIGERVGRD